MSGDPVTLAVVGAGIGAMTNRRDPIKGAILGGTLGYGGGLAAGSAASYGAAVPGLAATGPNSQAAMLAAQTGEFGMAGTAATAAAGSAPGSIGSGAWNALSRVAPDSAASPLTRRDQLLLANQSIRGMMQEQTPPAVGPSSFPGAKAVTTTEPIQSLLAMAQPRRRERMSLL